MFAVAASRTAMASPSGPHRGRPRGGRHRTRTRRNRRRAHLVEVADNDLEVADRVASVVGLSASSYQVGELFWGIRRFFELAAATRPIVVLFDDIHWAEPTFLDLIDHLIEATKGAALLILCTARHELHRGASGLGPRARSRTHRPPPPLG